MALDGGFMAQITKIPYFRDLVDAHGQEWLESVFESLETRSYDFPVATLQPAMPGENEGAPAEGAAAPVDSRVAAKFAQPADGSESSGWSDVVDTAAQGYASAYASAETPTRNFDNQTEPPIHSDSYTDKGTHWRNALFYSARDSDESVRVALAGAQESLKLSSLDDKIYTYHSAKGGNTTVSGGDGTDTLFLTVAGLKVKLDGKNDFGRFGGKVAFDGIENVVGSDGNDKITGDGRANELRGGLGNDTIVGGAGADTISGGNGRNNLSGGDGNDTITAGMDDDTIDGGADSDDIGGGGGNDKISGGGGNDVIDGGVGDDRIAGGEGSDQIDGGFGNDVISGDAGDDKIEGGLGRDTIDGGSGDDTINGGGGNDKIDGGQGDDTLNGDGGNDTIDGGAGVDTIDGGAGNDAIDGGAGDDSIKGGDGKDTIDGGDGKDTIDGGAGDDKITGGKGADKLTGGAGADVFVYVAEADSGIAADTFDIITDFKAADDKFDLTALLTGDTFDFLATEGAAFTGNDPEVRWDKTGGKTLVEIDVDGDGTADMKIELQGEINLTATNFNL